MKCHLILNIINHPTFNMNNKDNLVAMNKLTNYILFEMKINRNCQGRHLNQLTKIISIIQSKTSFCKY